MKLLLLLFTLTILQFTGFCQSATFSYNGKNVKMHPKLISHYGDDYLNSLKEDNIDLLLYLNYYVEFSYKIEDIGIKAQDGYKNISSYTRLEKSKAPLFVSDNPDSFNILSYDIQLGDALQVIPTGYKDDAIVVKSKADFVKQFNEYKSQLFK